MLCQLSYTHRMGRKLRENPIIAGGFSALPGRTSDCEVLIAMALQEKSAAGFHLGDFHWSCGNAVSQRCFTGILNHVIVFIAC